jgi:hypothetical protein
LHVGPARRPARFSLSATWGPKHRATDKEAQARRPAPAPSRRGPNPAPIHFEDPRNGPVTFRICVDF